MANEFVLAEVVRAWANQESPGDAQAAERAAAAARDAYASGASVDEACRTARAFLASWTCHPAHQKGCRGDVAVPRLAS